MGGSRTGLVSSDTRDVTANIREHSNLEHRMKPLPRPTTFAEGQRFVYGLLAAAAGMFCGLMAIAMTALLMWGGWSRSEEHSIVIIFAGRWAGSSGPWSR